MFRIWFGYAGNIVISVGDGQVPYKGNLGWNMQGELDFTGIKETAAETGVHKRDLVTTPPPHEPGLSDTEYLGVHKEELITISTTPPPPPPPTRTDRDSGVGVRTFRTEVGQRKWILIEGVEKSSSCEITHMFINKNIEMKVSTSTYYNRNR